MTRPRAHSAVSIKCVFLTECMVRLWNRLNHSFRNQVLLRILPGLALAFLGIFWVGGGNLIRTAEEQRAMANLGLMHQMGESLAFRASQEALGLLLQEGEGPSDEIRLIPGERGPSSNDLEKWTEKNHVLVKPDFRPATWSGLAQPGDPVASINSDEIRVLTFPPVRSWVPVTLTLSSPRGTQTRVTGVPLDGLLDPLPEGLNYRILDDRGQVLYAGADWPSLPPSVQSDLNRPASNPATLRLGRPLGVMVHSARSGDLGIQVQLVDSLTDLNRAVVMFLVIGALCSLAGIILTGWVIIGHTGRASRQLNQLAINMEALAAGDYSGRMPRPENNEVGRLIGYFNLMAVSLDEAHRQVNEKAARLRTALENMRMLDKAKDNFLVLISHEVRTPLTAIMGGVDYLKKSVEQVEGQDREILDRLNVEEITGIIQSSGERLSGFMNDAIQMTTLGSAESLLKLQPVPVNELLSECLGPVQAMARRREITIHDLLNGKVDWVLLCDPGVLQVGLAKILQNAVQHNRDGGVIIIREASTVPGEGAIHEIVTREGVRRMESQPGFEEFADEELRWKILEIFNTGDPIPEEKRAALFGKFEVLGPIENHQKGTGLSLPIAKAALESHGGGVYLHCDETDGNTFYLLLPVLKVSPGSRAASRVQEILAGNQQGQSLVSTAWDEDICEVADATPFDVEFEEQCASILGCIDEAGSRVNRAGSADDKEKVTITSDSE